MIRPRPQADRRRGHPSLRLWGILVAAACGDSASTAVPTPAVSVPAVPATSAKPPDSVPRKPQAPVVTGAIVRVASLEGTPSHDGAALTVGVQIGQGATLSLVRGDRIALDVAQSGRVSVDGPAMLQLGVDSDGQLLTAAGVITVLVPPAGDGRLIAQRLATPRTTFAFRPGTTAVVAVDRSGDVLVNVLDGVAEVVSTELPSADSGADDVPANDVNRGSAQRFGPRGVAMLKPAEDLADAVSRARTFVDAPSRSVPPTMFEPSRLGVEECLAQLADEVAQAKQIELRHKQAIAAGSNDERVSIQRELAAHGQRLFRLRRVLLARWERVQVASLMLDADARIGVNAALRDLRQRVVTGLPR